LKPQIAAIEAQLLTAGMIKRLVAATMVLCACLELGACTSFSGYVADSWPTWAGGMPKDVPPRPGAPGYEEFIAHQHKDEAAAPAAAAPAPVAATVPAADNPTAQTLPPAAPRPEDRSAVQGGLY
jgi:hypothetical protein